jgi:WhiB family redox-sensing transcriptional regulator
VSARSWLARAACHGEDPELFFSPEGERGPEKAAREARAVAVCDRCPVRLDCLAVAPAHGVYGGMTEAERESRRRRQARDRLAEQRRGAAA